MTPARRAYIVNALYEAILPHVSQQPQAVEAARAVIGRVEALIGDEVREAVAAMEVAHAGH